MAEEYDIGDTIEVTYRGKVQRTLGRGVLLEDGYVWHDAHAGRVRVVKRRPIAVDDVITGRQLRARMWKRGSVIEDELGARYILNADAGWVSSESGPTVDAWSFNDFGRSEKLTVRLVA